MYNKGNFSTIKNGAGSYAGYQKPHSTNYKDIGGTTFDKSVDNVNKLQGGDLNTGRAGANPLDKYVKEVMTAKIGKQLAGGTVGSKGNMKPKTLEG